MYISVCCLYVSLCNPLKVSRVYSLSNSEVNVKNKYRLNMAV